MSTRLAITDRLVLRPGVLHILIKKRDRLLHCQSKIIGDGVIAAFAFEEFHSIER